MWFAIFAVWCAAVSHASEIVLPALEDVEVRTACTSCDTTNVCNAAMPSISAGSYSIVGITNTPNCLQTACNYYLEFVQTNSLYTSDFVVYAFTSVEAHNYIAGLAPPYLSQISMTTAASCFNAGGVSVNSATGPVVFVVVCSNSVLSCSVQYGPPSNLITVGAAVTPDPCQSHTTSCSDCTGTSGCGWCSSTTFTIGSNSYSNLPQCNSGTASGPTSIYCSGTWYFAGSSTICPSAPPTGPPLVNGCLTGAAYCTSSPCVSTVGGQSYCCPPGSDPKCTVNLDISNSISATCVGCGSYPQYTAIAATTAYAPPATTTAFFQATTTALTTTASSSNGCVVGASNCAASFGSCSETVNGQTYCCPSGSTSCSISITNGVLAVCSCSAVAATPPPPPPAPSPPSPSFGGGGSPASTPPSVGAADTSGGGGGGSSSSNIGPIVGGVVGGVAGAAIIAGVVVFLIKKKLIMSGQRQVDMHKPQPPAAPPKAVEMTGLDSPGVIAMV